MKIRDKNFPDIYIVKVTKSETFNGREKKHSRKQNSSHACFFCGRLCSHIQDHLQRCHRDKEEVKDILDSENLASKGGTERMKNLLRAKGDHKHNMEVKEKQKGQYLLYRRPTENFDHRLFGPCPCCLEWMLQSSLAKHQKKCKSDAADRPKTFIPRKRHLKAMSDIQMGNIDKSASTFLVNEVFTIMRNDEIGLLARTDNLILHLGEIWLKNCIDNKIKRAYWASQHMRHAARLLIELRKLDEDNTGLKSMSDYLRPAYFEILIQASLQTCMPSIDDFEDLKSPSNALKIKYDIITMAERKATYANQLYDKTKEESYKQLKKEAEGLLGDMQREWKTKVTKVAKKVMNERKLYARQCLPDPADIKKLSEYLKEKLETANLDSNSVCWENFRELVVYAQARLLIYNKRRSGEVEGTTVKNLVHKLRVDDIDDSLIGELSMLEKYLINSQDLIQVRGKFNRIVPLLIPKDCQSVLNFLADASVRMKVNVPRGNEFLFPNRAFRVIAAYECLKQACGECLLRTPERITGTAMRKYMATLAQTLDLNPQQFDWMCKHLGHSKSVHLTHYRQMSSFIERVSVGKVLLMQDLNLQGRFTGKKLEDIDFRDMLNETPDFQSDEAQEDSLENQLQDVDVSQGTADIDDSVAESQEEEYVPSECESESPVKKKKTNTQSRRQRWSEIEMSEIEKYFKSYLETMVTPRKPQVISAKDKSRKHGGEIQYRHWHLIVKKVSAMIQSRKKKCSNQFA